MYKDHGKTFVAVAVLEKIPFSPFFGRMPIGMDPLLQRTINGCFSDRPQAGTRAVLTEVFAPVSYIYIYRQHAQEVT
jgi:hypothetical protein